MSNYQETVHRFLTKFGFKTRHKFPSIVPQEKKFVDLTNQLYPTGRAWRVFNGNNLEKVHRAINDIFLQFQEESSSLLNTVIPDNEFFTIEDCLYWEGKLGMITNNLLTLEQRRQIILNKLAFPKNIKSRQSLNYIQNQLNLYGFTDVKVYANIFQDINGNYYHKSPEELSNEIQTETQHGGITQHGNSTQHGDSNFDVIANDVNEENYSIGGNENLYATFFIASPVSLLEKGSVSNSRKKEFKELVLKLKPAHLVAFTFINYI